jgi:hypothetical protein
MQSKKACDHNDNNYYADDIENIHCFVPIERLRTKLNLGGSTAVASLDISHYLSNVIYLLPTSRQSTDAHPRTQSKRYHRFNATGLF